MYFLGLRYATSSPMSFIALWHGSSVLCTDRGSLEWKFDLFINSLYSELRFPCIFHVFMSASRKPMLSQFSVPIKES